MSERDAETNGRDAAFLFLSPDVVPERWRSRAVPLSLVALSPGEASQVLDGTAAQSDLNSSEEILARLTAKGLSARAIARELGVSLRTVYRDLADLRERFGVASRDELVAHLAERGFRG